MNILRKSSKKNNVSVASSNTLSFQQELDQIKNSVKDALSKVSGLTAKIENEISTNEHKITVLESANKAHQRVLDSAKTLSENVSKLLGNNK